MASSEVEIINLALIELGASTITARSDDSKEARTMNAIFDLVRDATLRDAPWNFAKTRASLTIHATPPVYGYGAQYQIPYDCLKLLYLEYPDVKYVVENGFILTNDTAGPIKCQYVKRVTDVSKFDASFVMALAYSLAKEASYAITQSTTRVDQLSKMYEQKILDARSLTSQEGGTPPQVWADEWNNARY
jgi:hypothetical protein